MKKGRPAVTLAALGPVALASKLATVMLTESTSLGVRFTAMTRVTRPRTHIGVDTQYGSISVKVSGGPFGAQTVKPEFDMCVQRAREHGVPVRLVIAAALRAYDKHPL
jgi:pyridinium-3,5-bisthiocarboxylic acid mononucleotide nickel chelatase